LAFLLSGLLLKSHDFVRHSALERRI
jgi:hypothetical protein